MADGSAYTAMTDQEREELDRLRALVQEAMTIRMYGEWAPGGNENWADWDAKAETELRNE